MSIDLITLWHQRARPSPSFKNFNVQLGCHFEEIVEMIQCLEGADEASGRRLFDAYEAMVVLANELKAGEIQCEVPTEFRRDMLDSIADQIVTGVGVAHCAKMNITEATRRVNTSNWSKYDHEGKPIFDKNGKITKGPNYQPVDLTGLY